MRLAIVFIGLVSVARAQPPEEHPIKVSAKVGKGFTFSAGDYFSLAIRGRMMLRYTFLEHDGDYQNEFTIRRARIYLQGHTFSKHIQYYFHVAFANQDMDGNNPAFTGLYDAYVQLTYLRDFQVRIGQQLVPFNKSRVISSQNAELVDRSIVNAELNLDRDIGIKFFSSDVGGHHGIVGYEVFVGVGNGRSTTMGNVGPLIAARLQINPLGKFEDYTEADIDRTPKPKLSIGINYAYNWDAQRQRGTTGKFYTLGDFDMQHGAVDLMFKFRGFFFFSEWMLRWAKRNFIQAFDKNGMLVTEWSRSAHGYFLQAGYLMPHNLEVAMRWSQLFTLQTTDPDLEKFVRDQGKELAAGFSWYFRGHILKAQADYAYLFGDDIARGRHQMRIQIHVGY